MYIEITDKWNDKLLQFSESQKDIYFSESYVKLATGKDETPLCVICTEDGKIMLLPFLRSVFKEFFDFETPYGYKERSFVHGAQNFQQRRIGCKIRYYDGKLLQSNQHRSIDYA